jgi:diadenosine tetraphosphate (Ap4A) HIT family hydrolase
MKTDKDCIFCKIIKGEGKSWIIWEDEKNIAFLTPYPNTEGFTVIASKEHLGSYIFDLPDEDYFSMLTAAKKVGHLLDRALNVKRTGLIMEGMGVDHAHIKLIPLHGIPDGLWTQHLSSKKEFNEKYQGHITSADGPKMDDEVLDRIQQQILTALKKQA